MTCKYIFSSFANLKCTPSDRQMYPWGTLPQVGNPWHIVSFINLWSCSAQKATFPSLSDVTDSTVVKLLLKKLVFPNVGMYSLCTG